ncbi:hypothetical protein [Antribacter gilvus]|uniref:hypothetical protein n=1 Tax=Antribacter gilvus TaxID=2304675 RepID=UPI000F795793|nr:hypothetical protein [Antribacter gilvus]
MNRSVARPARRIVVVLAAAAVAAALGACSPQDLVDGAVENAVEQQTGADVDVETDGSLPADFPADVVPLVDGKISHGVGNDTDGGKVWIVAMEYDGTADEATTAARDALTAAGFAEPEGMTGMGLLEKDDYQVLVVSAGQGGVTALSYTVTLRPAG